MEPIAWSDDERSWPLDVYRRCVDEYPDDPISGTFNLGEAPIWMRDVTLIVRVQTYVCGAGFGAYMHSFDPWARMLDAVRASCERVGLDGFIPPQREAIELWWACRRTAHDEFKRPAVFGPNDERDLHDRCYRIYRQSGGDEIDARVRDSVPDLDDRLLDYVKRHKDLPTAYDLPDTRKNREASRSTG